MGKGTFELLFSSIKNVLKKGFIIPALFEEKAGIM